MTPHQILEDVFGYPSFRGDQEKIIKRALEGKHCLVLMPTGMGKSLCYQIPSRISNGLTVVISPLIALMKDQVDAALKNGFRCCFINSSLSKEERNARYRNLANKEYELIYVTPERFQKDAFCNAVKKNQISLLAIDEAHCISQWGHDFRPDYTRMAEFRTLLGNPPTMALTATATREVQDDIVKQLAISQSDIQTYDYGIERENLSLGIVPIHGLENKVEEFVRLRENEPGPVIVYFSLIYTLTKFSEELQKREVSHFFYHGRMNERARKQTQNEFMQSDDSVILATPAFGLGVNKANIRMVVHAEVPGSIEAYYQEVGRAGRDGKPARGILLYDEDDITVQMDFIKWANPDPDFIIAVYRLIDNNRDRVRAEGYDFLRSQMNFYNSRDFRVETAVNLLERWDCVEGEIERNNIQALRPPEGPFMDRKLHAIRLRRQQEKLLEIVKFAKLEDGYKERLREYFS